MDAHKLRSLAGLPRLNYEQSKMLEQKLSDVKPKVDVPDGTFTKKAKSIVSTLVKIHNGDKKKALKSLVFYINRAGKDVSNLTELEKAKNALKESVEFDDVNVFRARAGLPLLEKKEETEQEEDVPEDNDKEDKESDDEEDLPSIVKKLAKKAVGKEEEELEELLMKVYQAGLADGEKSKEENSEEELPDDENADDKKPKEKDVE